MLGGVPAEVAFATKPKLGLAMLQRALATDVPFAWVTGDSVYGADHRLRRLLERHQRGYVLAVTSAPRLGFKPVEDWLEDVPAKGWRRLSAGEGAKGPRLYDWAYLPYRSLVAEGWRTGLLIRRRISQPKEVAFYLTPAPAATGLAELVRVAGTRWAIEACFPPRIGSRRPGTPVRDGQGRGRLGSVRGALLDRMAQAHHAGHAGARLSRRGASGGDRGER